MTEMSDKGFARRFRPTTVAGYIGNERLKKSVFNLMRNGNRPPVFLLYGSSGCGKTTFARLLAKEYLCENRDEVTGACGCCPSCEAIDEYITTGSTDMLANVKEINVADASTRSKLEPVLEDMEIPSFNNEWKIYIFDECHAADDKVQNRMLKLVEEPPENVLIIFCTTNPERMIAPLSNRCRFKYAVTKPKVKELSGLLKFVCSQEEVDCDEKGLNFICNRSNCTIRDALSNLERVVSERESAKYTDVIEVFEEISDTEIVNFYKKLIGTPVYEKDGTVQKDAMGNPVYKRDVMGYVTLICNIMAKMDLNTFVYSVIDFTKKGIYVVNQIALDGVSDGELGMFRELFGDFTVEQMACLITKLSELQKGDVEMNLLTLGYKGIMDKETISTLNSGVSYNPNELVKEDSAEGGNRERIRKARVSEGTEKIEEMARTVNLSDLQSIFGGATVT